MIDLRSDTVTQPSSAMLSAMCSAPLGDDVLGDDPSVLELEEYIADLLGFESAIFVPSGTMANQIAIWLHSKKGSAVAVEQDAHIFHYEAAAPALISAVRLKAIPGKNGIMSAQSLLNAFPPDDPHFAPISLICLEDTANRGGGTVYPMNVLREIWEVAKTQSIPIHLDGARFFNAHIASQIPIKERTAGFDSASICFSKGLGAPVGSALCIPKALRRDAIRARKMLGGGMRQSGLLASAALYALKHNIPKLAEDHQKAQMLAKGLQESGYDVQVPQSNMVYFSHPNAPLFQAEALALGVKILALDANTIRAVPHLNLSFQDIRFVIDVFKKMTSISF